jgi:hypothetical protein
MQSEEARIKADKLADAHAALRRILNGERPTGYNPRIIDSSEGPNRAQRRENARLRKQGRKK